MINNKKVISIVLNNFKNDSRVLKENISLQNTGYAVQVIALHEEGLKEHETVKNISVHRIRLKSRNWSKHKLVQLIKYLEFIYKAISLCKKSDVLHCNDLNSFPVGVIIKKFFNKNVKIVYDAHEYEINDVPNENKYKIKFKYYLEKVLIKYADKVITVSDAIADEYVKLYSIDKPALVLNTPPYKEIEKKDIFRETFNIAKDKTIFLYQGGLSRGRGIEILLEAFRTTDNRESVIVFMGYGVLKKTIINDAKKHSNIYFHEAVTPDVLLDFTCSADFGILFYENSCLNHEYCSPNKMFEYLMAEIPVIVSNLYEMKRLTQSYKVGVVAKENTPDGLKEAIKVAVKLDKEELQKNIQKVKKIYNWEEQEKVFFDVYRNLNND